MEKSYDSFWKWGNARKKMAYTKDICLEGGSCSMPHKASSVANGFSFKIDKEICPLNIRQCMDAVFGPGSHMISEVNASKFGGPCKDLGTPVGSSSMEVNLSNSKYKNIKVNCESSPTSVIRALNASSSLQISSTDSDTISCHPHGDLNPQSFPCSDEKLLQDGNLNDEEEPSELRVRKMDQKAGSGKGIRNSYVCCERESSMEDPMYCSISEEADEDMQLQQWRIKEGTRNSKPMGGSVTISNDMDSSFKKRKSYHSLITNDSLKIQKENPESFAALNMLADVAVWVLENGYKEDDKAMASPGQWQIFHPSAVSSSHKIVIKRAKNDSKSLPPELPAHAQKLLPSLSEHLLASKLGSPRYNLKCQDSEVKEHEFADKDKVDNLNVRSSKRNRSQYLSSKYADSVLEPLKRGTKR